MNQRNYALDGLKFILAIFVVFIHQKTPYTMSLMPLIKSAVPAFLMISGYCIYTIDYFEERCAKAIKHMLWLCTWSIGFFALLQLFLVCIGREEYFIRCSSWYILSFSIMTYRLPIICGTYQLIYTHW